LFQEDGQDVQLINLSILPPWVAGFRAAETNEGLEAARFGAGRLRMVGQIEVGEMRRKRYKAPSHVLDRRPFADRSGFAPPVR
jgi:hypothetical protein